MTTATAQASVSSIHSPVPVSKEKLAANRRNAQLSTGPRTEHGKQAASMNAISHGLCARKPVLYGEDATAFEALRSALRQDLAPQDSFEDGLVDTITTARWKLCRLDGIERGLYEETVVAMRRRARRRREKLRWRERPDTVLIEEARADAAAATAVAADPSVDRVLAIDFARPASAFERLSRYEQRLEQHIARAMRELRLHRKDLREFGRADPEPTEPAEAQNEPTADESPASDGAAGGCDDASSSMGVPPMSSSVTECMGETPMLRKKDQTPADPPPGGAD